MTYIANYMAKRRVVAIANGICLQCFADKARPGYKRCLDCAIYGRELSKKRNWKKVKA